MPENNEDYLLLSTDGNADLINAVGINVSESYSAENIVLR